MFNYYVFDLQNEIIISQGQKPVDTLHHSFAGRIRSSLWNAFSDYDIDPSQIPALTARMEDALAWSVDFHHLQPEDHFKLIYDEYFLDGVSGGSGEMKAGYLHTFIEYCCVV